jgi:type II secretory pathway pseudopilin PulG
MSSQKGFTLLDILLAIVIFVVGMLALAALQTNLTRSATDANFRTMASNVGEEILEELRTFRRVSTDPDGQLLAFADIDSDYIARTVQLGLDGDGDARISFTVTGSVDGYNFNSDKTDVIKFENVSAGTVYDFKVAEVTVNWNANQTFLTNDGGQPIEDATMGTGSITLKELIPSIPSLANAKVAADDDGALGTLPVPYTPGARPDILAIDLKAADGARFKESTTPEPDVIRTDELVETWFDVITFNQATDTVFLRREEFLVVTCACTWESASGNEGDGFLPTTWTGEFYTEGDWVPKTYGVSASNQQSQYCDTCCRDHHDSGSHAGDDTVYDPQKDWTKPSTTVSGDHAHFGRDNQGNLTEVGIGDDYVEACRMVRKDGFLRVAQDFRQEGLIAVPQTHFLYTANVNAYSDYVTGTVDDFYNNGAPLKSPSSMSPKLDLPGDASTHSAGNPNTVPLPTAATASSSDQQVARAIYIDHLTTEAKEVLACINAGGTGEKCSHLDATSYLEYYPFFEVQLTFLADWVENKGGDPVMVSSEQIEDNNSHSRGMAELTSSVSDIVTVTPITHRGNLGFTGTAEIDDLYDFGLAEYDLLVDANNAEGNPDPPGPAGAVTATIGSYSNSVDPASVGVEGGGGAYCSLVGTTITCDTSGTTQPTITISGYWKNASTDLWICESTGTMEGYNVSQASPKSTTFNLPFSGNLEFTISNAACPSSA